MKASVTLVTDTSAARGIIHREGLGKLRHLETGYSWLQAAVKNNRLQVRKVLCTENPADLFTKPLTYQEALPHTDLLLSNIPYSPEIMGGCKGINAPLAAAGAKRARLAMKSGNPREHKSRTSKASVG